MKKMTSRVLHYEEGSSDKIYILSVDKERSGVYGVVAYYGAVGLNKLNKAKKSSDSTLTDALEYVNALARQKINKGYVDIESARYNGRMALTKSFPYSEYLSFRDLKEKKKSKEKRKASDMTSAEVLTTPLPDLIECIDYCFEKETPEDAYNEGLELVRAMKSNSKSDRKMAVAKSIKRFGQSFLQLNSLKGEDEVDVFESAVRLKAVIERGTNELKEEAILEIIDRLENGVDKIQDKKLHLNLIKEYLPNSKVAEEEIFEVAVCLDNIGLEDSFDLGVGYCFEEDTKGKDLMKIFDKTGKIVLCNNERFEIEKEEVED